MEVADLHESVLLSCPDEDADIQIFHVRDQAALAEILLQHPLRLFDILFRPGCKVEDFLPEPVRFILHLLHLFYFLGKFRIGPLGRCEFFFCGFLVCFRELMELFF